MVYLKALGYFMEDFVISLPRMIVIFVVSCVILGALIAIISGVLYAVIIGIAWLVRLCAPAVLNYCPQPVEVTIALIMLVGVLFYLLFEDKWKAAVKKAKEGD
jgi:hypothetical protein